MSFTHDKQGILALNQQIEKLFVQENFELLNQALEKRLASLKVMHEKAEKSVYSAQEIESYLHLLQEVQDNDQQQFPKIRQKHQELTQSTLKINKNKLAVDAYKNVFKS